MVGAQAIIGDSERDELRPADAAAPHWRPTGGQHRFRARHHSLWALPALSHRRHLRGRLDPAQARRLPPALHDSLLHAFANALHGVFIWGLGFMALAFALSWGLREVPLRESNQPSAGEKAATAVGAPGEAAPAGT